MSAQKKEKPRWKKRMGTGPHIMADGTVVKCGETIRAWPEEIRGAIDKFEPVDYILPEDGGMPGPPTPESTLRLVHRGKGRYNVVDQNGNAINDKPMSKEDAMSLLNGTPLPEVNAPVEVDNPPESEAVRKAVGRGVKKQQAAKDAPDKPAPHPIPVPEGGGDE
jgi:hypothetical protein